MATHSTNPVDRAEERLDDLTAPDHPRKYADTDAPATHSDMVTEQRRETAELGPFGTESQRKGVVGGGVVGGLIGALLLLPLGFVGWGADVADPIRFLTCAAIGLIAGSTAGAVYWGGRLPELEGETVGADNQPGSGTSVRDPRTDERGRPTDNPTGPVSDPRG